MVRMSKSSSQRVVKAKPPPKRRLSTQRNFKKNRLTKMTLKKVKSNNQKTAASKTKKTIRQESGTSTASCARMAVM